MLFSVKPQVLASFMVMPGAPAWGFTVKPQVHGFIYGNAGSTGMGVWAQGAFLQNCSPRIAAFWVQIACLMDLFPTIIKAADLFWAQMTDFDKVFSIYSDAIWIFSCKNRFCT